MCNVLLWCRPCASHHAAKKPRGAPLPLSLPKRCVRVLVQSTCLKHLQYRFCIEAFSLMTPTTSPPGSVTGRPSSLCLTACRENGKSQPQVALDMTRHEGTKPWSLHKRDNWPEKRLDPERSYSVLRLTLGHLVACRTLCVTATAQRSSVSCWT